MWISKAAWDELQQLLLVERQNVVALERTLAQSQSNVDWLRTMFNSMSNDRAAIATMRFGTPLPAIQLAGTLRTPEDVKRAVTQKGPQVIGTPAPPEGLVTAIAEEEDLDKAMARYTGMAGGMDDIGDDAAAALGIEHNPQDGTLEFTK